MKIKTNINGHGNSIAVMALLLMVAAVLACSLFDDTNKANKLVDEGNAAITDAKKLAVDADEKKGKMDDAVSAIKKGDAGLEAARSMAKDLIAAYDKTKAKEDEAAKKFEEASKLKTNDKFKEYLQIMTKEFQKRSELFETAKGIPQALIDSKNREAYNTATNAVNEKLDKLRKEADDLDGQATKIQKDNPDVFKK